MVLSPKLRAFRPAPSRQTQSREAEEARQGPDARLLPRRRRRRGPRRGAASEPAGSGRLRPERCPARHRARLWFCKLAEAEAQDRRPHEVARGSFRGCRQCRRRRGRAPVAGLPAGARRAHQRAAVRVRADRRAHGARQAGAARPADRPRRRPRPQERLGAWRFRCPRGGLAGPGRGADRARRRGRRLGRGPSRPARDPERPDRGRCRAGERQGRRRQAAAALRAQRRDRRVPAGPRRGDRRQGRRPRLDAGPVPRRRAAGSLPISFGAGRAQRPPDGGRARATPIWCAGISTRSRGASACASARSGSR